MAGQEHSDFEAHRPVAFISHHSTQVETARHLKKLLERHNIGSWLAPDDIDAGLAFDRAITQQIRNSDLIILLFCAKSDQSRHVKRELMMAEDAGKLICPVRLEDIAADGLAYWLNDYQWTDWFDRHDAAIARLVESIKRQVNLKKAEDSEFQKKKHFVEEAQGLSTEKSSLGEPAEESVTIPGSNTPADETSDAPDSPSFATAHDIAEEDPKGRATFWPSGLSARSIALKGSPILALLALGAFAGSILSRSSDRELQMEDVAIPPRNERVADAVQQGMEERGLEVIAISFEEDSDDRNIYMGEAVVRLEGSDREIRSTCRVTVDEEQTISESDCPDITAAMRAANLENQIIQHYRGRNIEALDVAMQGDAGGSFTGYAELRNPQTGQPTRVNCTGEMTDNENASWNCEQ